MQGSRNTYWGNIIESVKTLSTGLKLTMIHFLKGFKANRRPIGVDHPEYLDHNEGVFTLQYPNESFPVPDNGRYRLDNEIEDCIVCDKCVKICPVNCIEIETIRSSEEIRKASDGSSIRLYAAKFDIDMGKCMYCGLCTTVCPTECLTMTKTYDYSEFKITDLVYNYSDLSAEQVVEKQDEWDVFQEEKKKAAAAKKAVNDDKAKSAAPLPKIGGVKPKIAVPKVGAAPKVPVPKKKTENEGDKPKAVVPKPKVSGGVKIPTPKIGGTAKPVIPKPKKKED